LVFPFLDITFVFFFCSSEGHHLDSILYTPVSFPPVPNLVFFSLSTNFSFIIQPLSAEMTCDTRRTTPSLFFSGQPFSSPSYRLLRMLLSPPVSSIYAGQAPQSRLPPLTLLPINDFFQACHDNLLCPRPPKKILSAFFFMFLRLPFAHLPQRLTSGLPPSLSSYRAFGSSFQSPFPSFLPVLNKILI